MPEVPSPDWLSLAFWTQDPESVRNLFVIAGGFCAGFGGFALLWWRTWNIHRQTETLMRRHDAQVEADRERRITDNLTRAVEQLGSDKVATRLGAIYALERIARESPADHWPIMETLTAYLREQAPWPPIRTTEGNGEEEKHLPRPATDVQAVLTVIARRRREYERADQRLDLSETDLRGCQLGRAHLENVSFMGAHLENASLWDAHLQGAVFYGAHLEGTRLVGARLEGATFFDTHLEGAWLGASDLTQEQFDNAYTDDNTYVPLHIKRPGKPAVEVAEVQHELMTAPG